MHFTKIFSTLGLASLALAGPVQVAERQTQKLRISKHLTLFPSSRRFIRADTSSSAPR